MFGDSDEGTRKGVEKAERCLSVSIVQRLRFWIVKVNHHFLSGIDKDVIALSSVAKLAIGIFWFPLLVDSSERNRLGTRVGGQCGDTDGTGNCQTSGNDSVCKRQKVFLGSFVGS